MVRRSVKHSYTKHVRTYKSKKVNRHKKRRRSTKRHRRSTKRRHRTKQYGGVLEEFTEDDFGKYDYDEYMEIEPEEYDEDDEGYIPDDSTTLEYNGEQYPIYTDIDEDDQYIMLGNEDGETRMVKISAVYREKNKN